MQYIDKVLQNYNALFEEEEYLPEELDAFPINETDLVVLYKPVIRLKDEEHTFFIAEGVYCIPDGEGGHMADWALTWIWTDYEDPASYLYFEQDPVGTAIHNFAPIAQDAIGADIWRMEAEILSDAA